MRLQQVYLSVSDVEGNRVTDLDRSEISVVDEGVVEDVVTFETGEAPFTAVILVDASLSMAGTKLENAMLGAQGFVRGMAPLDEAKLVVFNDRVVYQSAFEGRTGTLASGLPDLAAGGGTAGNDALYLAIKLLEKRQGRRTVVLLSDGVDVHSALGMEEVLHKVRHSQAQLFWLKITGERGVADALRRSRRSAWRDAVGHAAQQELLADAVEESGGRVIPVRIEPDIGPAFREVLEELRSQVVIGYYCSTPRHDGGWRRVTVRFDRAGVPPIERGYIDF